MTICEWCPILAMCISKDSGKCSLIYKELNKSKDGIPTLRSCRVLFTPYLSEYRKVLKMKVIYVRPNEKTIRFIK
jgi:hypothetical protein